HHFASISVWGLMAFALLIGVCELVNIFAPAIAAKGRKASKLGALGAMLGGLLGVFTLGPIGIFLGPFIGAYLGEMLNSANAENALKVATASMFGIVIGSTFK